MKEQIKNLTIQAREHADSLLGKGLPDMVWQDEYNQKFAHLIVQECVEICRKGINNATDWDSSYWDQACENRAETIQQHFGVTE